MNFDKEPKCETKHVGLKVKKGVGGGGNTDTKTVSQTDKRSKIQNSNQQHNVKHVVQSTFQNMRITFKVQLSSK